MFFKGNVEVFIIMIEPFCLISTNFVLWFILFAVSSCIHQTSQNRKEANEVVFSQQIITLFSRTGIFNIHSNTSHIFNLSVDRFENPGDSIQEFDCIVSNI